MSRWVDIYILPFNISADCPETFGCLPTGSVDASGSDIRMSCKNANAAAIAMCLSDQVTKLWVCTTFEQVYF